jgi:nitrogen PTS system EIIA component
MDRKPTFIFFVILTPEAAPGQHLVLLARISRLLKENTFKEKLLAAKDADQVLQIIEEVDEDF